MFRIEQFQVTGYSFKNTNILNVPNSPFVFLPRASEALIIQSRRYMESYELLSLTYKMTV